MAILLALGGKGQVVRAASDNLDPTFANGAKVLIATGAADPAVKIGRAHV